MALFFSFLNYTDSNFGANDGTITNITVSGGTGTVAVTIKNSANITIYTGAVPPGLIDQLNLPPDIYTLSAIDQVGEISEDLEIIITEKPATILTANITDACDCPDCDCIVTVSNYIHNSDCFLYELYDGTTLIDTYQACTGSEYHQFTGLCTGNYSIQVTELDSLLYTYSNPDNCIQGDIVIDTAVDVTNVVQNWRRFALSSRTFDAGLGVPPLVTNNGNPIRLLPGTNALWTGLQLDGTIQYNPVAKDSFFFTGGNPASYTDPVANIGCPGCTGTTPLDPDASRFLGAFSGGRDGLNPVSFPAGYPVAAPLTTFLYFYYYNLDNDKFVWCQDVRGSVAPKNHQWITFDAIDPIEDPLGSPLKWPNAYDGYTTSTQWSTPGITANDYTVDPANNNQVVLASLLPVPVAKKIQCAFNSILRNGFYSDCSYNNYVHEITIGSSIGDGDEISIILARFIDPVTGRTELLTLEVSPENDPLNLNSGAVFVAYNIDGISERDTNINAFNNGLTVEDPLFEASSLLIRKANPEVDMPLPVGINNKWNAIGKLRVRITRSGSQGELFKIEMTNMMGPGGGASGNGKIGPGFDNPYNPAYEINFSLLDINTWTDRRIFTTGTQIQGTELQKFSGPTSYGYATLSQPEADFYHIEFQGEQNNITNEPIDLPGATNDLDFTEPCQLCYLATNCNDPADTMLITLPANLPPLDLTVTYIFNEFPEQCWTVERSDDCGGEPGSAILINTGFIDAVDNLGVEDQDDFNWNLTVGQVMPLPSPAVITNQSFPGYGTLFNALWINQIPSPHFIGTSVTEYERTFVLPPAFIPSLVFDILSDVRAVVTLNGFVIGDNSNPVTYPNPLGTPANFSTSNPVHFNANPAINTLKVTITPMTETSGFALAGLITSPGEPLTSTPVTVQEIFIDCDDCLGVCYRLVDCEGIIEAIYTNSQLSGDLSAYVGQIITIVTCPETCWQLEELDCPPSVTETIVVVNSFPDCETCLPQEPVPVPFVNTNRTVKPGYDTKGCSPAYVEKISCSWSESLFQQAASVRYGIKFCCSADFPPLDIKKQLLDFELITDPDACKTITNPCCPPCLLIGEICVFDPRSCNPPENLTGELVLPPVEVIPNCVTMSFSVPKSDPATEYNISGTDCCGNPILLSVSHPNTVEGCFDLNFPVTPDPFLNPATISGNCDCDPVPPFNCFCIQPATDDGQIGSITGNLCDGTPFNTEVYPTNPGAVNPNPVLCVRADGTATSSPNVIFINNGECDELNPCKTQVAACVEVSFTNTSLDITTGVRFSLCEGAIPQSISLSPGETSQVWCILPGTVVTDPSVQIIATGLTCT